MPKTASEPTTSTRRTTSKKAAAKKSAPARPRRSNAKKATAKKATAKKPSTRRSGAEGRAAAQKAAPASRSKREENRMATIAVRAYIKALEAESGSRRVDVNKLNERLADAEIAARTASGLERLTAAQQVINLKARIDAAGDDGTAISEAEGGFITHAASYSRRHGITYAAYRSIGVPASVLRQAGITRANSK